jgi:hypothetical protein
MSHPAISELIQRLRQQWAALDPVDEWRADIAEAIETIEALRADAARLDWIERQHLEELSMALIVDAKHDGEYYVCGDDETGYGPTLRNAIDAAMSGKAVTPWA